MEPKIGLKPLIAALLLTIGTAPAVAAPSAEEMCRTILEDIARYQAATNGPCPCPYNLMRNGRACGNRAAWAKPNGRAPRCYFDDVTGKLGPNLSPSPTRESWPPPPPCGPALLENRRN
jgi:hypothetical protein